MILLLNEVPLSNAYAIKDLPIEILHIFENQPL